MTQWPGLAAGQLYQNQDLQVTIDYRDILSEIVSRRLGSSLGQTSDGRFPDQPNDIELAAMAARADFRCNGEVFAIGG